MNTTLHVGGNEFWRQFRDDVTHASESVLAQTLSFEGDSAGLAFSAALLSSQARDRRIIIDCFTNCFVNDRFIYNPVNHRHPAFAAEVKETRRLIVSNRASGIQIRFTNPVGFGLLRLPARNHKKLVLIDGKISYIGGINFSEHNFAWRDMMLRFEDEAVCAFLKADFDTTWNGKHRSDIFETDGLTLLTLDGRQNERLFERIFLALELARSSILVHSPYLSFPFYEHLRKAHRRGVEVMVLSPARNNRKSLAKYTLWEAARSGLCLRHLPGMSHLKAILIDESTLIAGSSNFDYLSYRLQQEILAIITDRGAVAEFARRVAAPDLAASIIASPTEGGVGMPRYVLLRMLGAISVAASKA